MLLQVITKKLPIFTTKFQERKTAELYRQDDFFGKLEADSADWTIQLLNINSAYNDFSPVIVHQNILFSSNKPQGKRKKGIRMGW